jgi:hypothetical protein
MPGPGGRFTRKTALVTLPEGVAEANGEDWKEAGVAEVVVVADFEGGEVLLEALILIYGLAAYRR